MKKIILIATLALVLGSQAGYAADVIVQAPVGKVVGRELGNMQGQDIMALAYIVMMEASKSSQEDLKELMGDVKATNSGKKPR